VVQQAHYGGDTTIPDRRTLPGAVPERQAGIRTRLANRVMAACLLGFLTVVLLTATAPDAGLTWDEPAYIAASKSYVEWFGELATHPGEALSAQGVRQSWELNHEHPPLDKIWSGFVWLLARPVFDDLTAHRLGNILLVGTLVALLYLQVGAEFGSIAGLASVGALLVMPRFFFHAHLAALDVPAAVTMFAVVVLFWRSYGRPGWKWSLVLGIAWGLALATKINAIFVMPLLGLWTLIFHRRWYLIVRLVVMGLIGGPLSLLLWPWLYHDSAHRLIDYLAFVTVKHWKIGQWYLNRFWMPPPWHFPFVMTIAVVPLTLTALYMLGVWRVVRCGRAQVAGWLFILGALFAWLPLTTGKSMVYDNERLFMPAFPNLAALAGIGLAGMIGGARRVARSIGRPRVTAPLALAVAGAAFVPPVAGAAAIYPHLLSYYSSVVGGLPGATRLGLESTYWCETYADALPYLNAHAKVGDLVWVEDYSHDVMLYYQMQGRLRSDLRISAPPGAPSVFERQGMHGYEAGIEDADWVIVEYRQTGFTDRVKSWLAGRTPVYSLSYEGVPLMEIYRGGRSEGNLDP
jgi:4-amino-4-deoxy-L-arabinose transferase-like glycosyltransferase